MHRREWLITGASLLPAAAAAAQKGVRMAEGLNLLTRVEISGEQLVLHYGVENRSTRDVYLRNRLHDFSRRIDANLAWIHLLTDRRLVWIFKDAPPVPPDMNVAMPIRPYVTPLRASKRFAESLRIALPVREVRAYETIPQDKRQERPATYAGLYFTLGYYWSVPGMKETEKDVNGTPVVVAQPPAGTQLQFGQLTSEVTSLELPVIEIVSA